MAWLWINGSFIDAPAVAARRTDLVLHSTWQQPSCQYFQQHWIKMGDFHPQSQLSSIATLKLHFQCFFLQFICLTFYLSTLHLPLSRPPEVPIFGLPHLFIHPPTSFLSPGWFPSGCPSLSTTVQPCESESNCLFNVNGSHMPGSPPFGVIVHLQDSGVSEKWKKNMRRGHANRCLIIASAGKTQ